jgi:hypothetical protein
VVVQSKYTINNLKTDGKIKIAFQLCHQY